MPIARDLNVERIAGIIKAQVYERGGGVSSKEHYNQED